MKQELVENIIWQADYFLKEIGEFYPFASVINRKGTLKPLGILLEKEKPEAAEVLKELYQVLESGLEKGEYQAYAIGINVLLDREKLNKDVLEENQGIKKRESNTATHQDAIEIRIHTGNQEKGDILYLPYFLNEASREIEFGEFVKGEK